MYLLPDYDDVMLFDLTFELLNLGKVLVEQPLRDLRLSSLSLFLSNI
jgi:hypothetical protein